ncbi:ATP-binding protein [Streptomyces sp. NPDC006372]|uniref:ATP-binding protein n=1 Tax=Streptomyces sp. NPDC006372 TaxID=3155599 RepID=UPI0033A3C5F8
MRGLWTQEGPPVGPHGVTHAQADAALAALDAPAAEAAWRAGPEAAPLREVAEAADRAVARLLDPSPSDAARPRLARLENVFGLDGAAPALRGLPAPAPALTERPDRDLLHLALAVALDPALGTLCAYLHDHPERPWASVELTARVFGHTTPGPISPESPLLTWRLVDRHAAPPGAPAPVVCDPQIVAWLLGRDHPDAALVGALEPAPLRAPLTHWPVEATAEDVARVLAETPAARVRVVVRAPEGSGRRTFAALVAATAAGLPAFAVQGADGHGMPGPQGLDVPSEADGEHVLRVHRQAFLDGVAPVWRGTPPPHTAVPDVFPLQFAATAPGRRPAPLPGVLDHVVDLPAPTTPDRRRLWHDHLPAAGSWPDLDRLAARFRATPGEIAAATAAVPADADEAASLLRRAGGDRAGDLAQLLDCPFTADDLVVPPHLRSTLDDLCFEASHRTAFWETDRARRMFPTGRALAALFAGPPGTGKTMAAQVVAARLGFDLWRVDLSTVVSKYVGETAENLDRVLRRAAGADVVLLFDEADALYGRRSSEIRDAQDRYVNMDTGHLMVAVENHDGVVLLATNHKGAIDPAFLRRLRYVVDFPRPDAGTRREIWTRTLAGLLDPADARRLEPDVALLAEQVETTGAQVKYAVLGAVFAARRAGAPVARVHLLAGLNRELGKEGRPLSDRDLERLVGG